MSIYSIIRRSPDEILCRKQIPHQKVNIKIGEKK